MTATAMSLQNKEQWTELPLDSPLSLPTTIFAPPANPKSGQKEDAKIHVVKTVNRRARHRPLDLLAKAKQGLRRLAAQTDSKVSESDLMYC